MIMTLTIGVLERHAILQNTANQSMWSTYETFKLKRSRAYCAIISRVAVNTTAYKVIEAIPQDKAKDPLYLWQKLREKYDDKQGGTSGVMKIAELNNLRIVGRDLAGYFATVAVLRNDINALGESISEAGLKSNLQMALSSSSEEDFRTTLRKETILKFNSLTFDEVVEWLENYDKDSTHLLQIQQSSAGGNKKASGAGSSLFTDDSLTALISRMKNVENRFN